MQSIGGTRKRISTTPTKPSPRKNVTSSISAISSPSSRNLPPQILTNLLNQLQKTEPLFTTPQISYLKNYPSDTVTNLNQVEELKISAYEYLRGKDVKYPMSINTLPEFFPPEAVNEIMNTTIKSFPKNIIGKIEINFLLESQILELRNRFKRDVDFTIFSLFDLKISKPLLNNEQISELEKFKEILTLSSENRDLIYQIVSQIREFGFEEVLKSLQSKKWDSLETYLREGSPGNDYSRRNLDLLLFNSIHKPEIIEGGYTCKCGSEKTESIRQQLRSADEPTSAKVTCMNPTCRRTWKVNA